MSESEESKPKKRIDLKSRLSNVRAAGSIAGSGSSDTDALDFPPPPVGSVPPPKISGSLGGLAPPAAMQAFVPVAEAAPPPPKVSAEQQTIKVDQEEVRTAVKKTARKYLVAVLVVAVAAMGAGFGLGGLKAEGDRGRKAAESLGALVNEIDESNKVMVELSDALGAAQRQLTGSPPAFPDELAEKLKTISIPFSGANIAGKEINALGGDRVTDLLSYATGVDDVNKKKDSLRNLLGIAKKPVEEYIAERDKPVVKFSIIFTRQSDQLVAQLMPNKAPFAVSDKWPETYTIVTPAGEKTKDVEVERYVKGDLIAEKPRAIPVDQKTVAAFGAEQIVFQLTKAMADTKALVDGRQSPDPSQETDGLIKDGNQLMEVLRKLAAQAASN